MEELIKEILEKSKLKVEEHLKRENINGTVEILFSPEENEALLKVFIPKLSKSRQGQTRYRVNQIINQTSEECASKNFRDFYQARSRIGTLISIGVSK